MRLVPDIIFPVVDDGDHVPAQTLVPDRSPGFTTSRTWKEGTPS
jgi:hypothetical protein